MRTYGRLGLAALAVMASLIFVSSAFAGGSNQIVQQSGGTVTWTGGTNNSPGAADDAVSISRSGAGQVTIHTTSSAVIDLVADTDTNANCAHDGTDTSTVICNNVTSVVANAGNGNDTVDAGALTDIPSTLNADASVDDTSSVDTLTGGGASDTLNSRTGGDTMSGGDGSDLLNGGDGNDTLNGDGGDDVLIGNDGADSINGGDGSDNADGGAGNDTIDGGPGNDDGQNCKCTGGLQGGPGDDTIHGGDGADYINGDGGNIFAFVAVQVVSTDGNDQLFGDAGDDQIKGAGGDDTIHGGDGSDLANGDDGNDTINGDGGNDAPTCCWVDHGLKGGNGNDTINGGDGIDYIDGGNDDDVINGDAGDDSTADSCPQAPASAGVQSCQTYHGGLYGHAGNDTINGGDGNDDAKGGNGNDIVNGNAGDDGSRNSLCNGCSGGELAGGTGDDIVNGGDGNDYIRGGPGADALNGDAGNDVIAGECDGSCDSNVDPATAGDTIDGGSGDDVVYGEDGNDNINGGSGDDQLNGDDGDDHVNGGDGTDDIFGGYGADTINGDAGDDNVYEFSDGSPDTANGGSGIDDLNYSGRGNPVSLTLDDVANDGEGANPANEDAGDPNNNYGSDLDNVHYYDSNCAGCAQASVNTPVTIVGTSGANLLFGAGGDDDITGGNGADYMSGGSGADTFHARDGYPDYIDCDWGVDTAIVDQFDTVHNCENVDRADVPSAFDTSKPPVPPVPPAGPASSPPPDLTPPVVTLTVPKDTFTAEQLVLGVRVSFACNEDCKLSLRLLAQQAPGSATFSRVKGYNVVVGRKTVGFGRSKRNAVVRPCERTPGGPQSKACLKRFKKALNSRLAKAGKVTMKLIAVTEDRSGNRTQRIKTITIRGKRK